MHDIDSHDQNDFDDKYDEDGYVIRPNKTQLKREAEMLLELGKKMAEMQDNQLNSIPLPKDIYNEIKEVQQMHQNAARKRQFKLIGKMLREIDATPIVEAVESIGDLHHHEVNAFHEIEQWRDRLIEEGDHALAELLIEHPMLDRQKIRQMMRQAAKEKQLGKPPRSSRVLFKYLKEQIS